MPAARDELGGEPVEQFGMRRVAAHRAEVVRRGDDALAEVVLPESIDDDAGRERVIGTREPFGERRAAAGGIWSTFGRSDLRLACAEELGEAGLHFLAGLQIVAAGEHAGWWGLIVAVEDGHRGGKRLGLDIVVLRQLFHLLVVELALVRLTAAIRAGDARVDPFFSFRDELLLETGTFLGRGFDRGERLRIVGRDCVLHGGLSFVG